MLLPVIGVGIGLVAMVVAVVIVRDMHAVLHAMEATALALLVMWVTLVGQRR